MYKGKSINQINKDNYQKSIANLNAANISSSNRPDPYKMIQQFDKNKSNHIQSNFSINGSNFNQVVNDPNFNSVNRYSSLPYQTNIHSISFQPIQKQEKNKPLELQQTQDDFLESDFFNQIIANIRQQKNSNYERNSKMNQQNTLSLDKENSQTIPNAALYNFWNNESKNQRKNDNIPSRKYDSNPFQKNNYNQTQANQNFLNQYQFKKQIKSNTPTNDYQIKHKNQKKQAKKKQYTFCNLKECVDDQKLITMDSLQKQSGPSIKNYIQANNEEWQKHQSVSNFQLMKALKNFPHIKNFKNNQKAIINCALTQNNIFVCMPTGGGKSLTFQILTFIKKGIYICILPLVSLIFDQQIQAKQFGIQAFSLTAGTDGEKYKKIINSLRNYYPEDNKSILIFCTPQKIGLSQNFIQVLEKIYQKGHLARFIIDEVHCVSTWGKQFRKQYQNLSNIKLKFPNVPILALTATVTQNLKQEIIKRLNITGCYFFQSSFNRPNLFYQVRNKNQNKIYDQMCKIIDQHKNQSGIIYCITKKQCQELCLKLKQKGYKIQFYHADVNENQKKKIQQDWMKNQLNIIVATIAFGMGINKPDVRYVIHYSLSKSLENYYQQSGRAGRDGNQAKCILFYLKSDINGIKFLNSKNQFSTNDVKNFGNKQLNQMIKYCQQKYICRRKLQLMYLGEKNFDQSLCKKTCDNCIIGKKFKYYQCIKQGKLIVKLVHYFNGTNQNITRIQLINICKGKQQKKRKINNKEELLQAFKQWTIHNIDQLIMELMIYQILIQKIVHTTIPKRQLKISNYYLQCNLKVANLFITKVQSLPMRRQFKMKNENNYNIQTNYNEQEVNQDYKNPQQTDEDELSLLIDQVIQQKKKQKSLMQEIDEIFQE